MLASIVELEVDSERNSKIGEDAEQEKCFFRFTYHKQTEGTRVQGLHRLMHPK